MRDMNIIAQQMDKLWAGGKSNKIKPAASIDGNNFLLAAQKYGLPTDIDSMNKIVNLVNSGMDVDSAAKLLAKGKK